MDPEISSEGNNNKPLRVVSWNINGIRKFQMEEIIQNFKCSILGLQETKVSRSKLSSSIALIDNYSSYFNFNHHKPAYNGVATYCHEKSQPSKAENFLSGYNDDFLKTSENDLIGGGYHIIDDKLETRFASFADKDGRVVLTEHSVETPGGDIKRLIVFNIYSPYINRQDPQNALEHSIPFKTVFHSLVARRAMNLVKEGCFVLLIGDLNTVHKAIDQSDLTKEEWDSYDDDDHFKWMDNLLSEENEQGFRDTFRAMHPNREKAFTCWNTQLSARENNYGTRIDYILADKNVMNYLLNAEIHPEFQGSDHCPVSATFNLTTIPSNKLPKTASKFYPEFRMKQATLVEIFQNAAEMKLKQKSLSPSTFSSSQPSMSVSSFPIATSSQPTTNIQKKRKLGHNQAKQSKMSDFFVKKQKPGEQFLNNSELNSDQKKIEEPLLSPASNIVSSMKQSSTPKTGFLQLPKPPKIPLCKHNELCVSRVVKKKGVHQGRTFYSCSRGKGAKDDPNGDCGFFLWR